MGHMEGATCAVGTMGQGRTLAGGCCPWNNSQQELRATPAWGPAWPVPHLWFPGWPV